LNYKTFFEKILDAGCWICSRFEKLLSN
jgi:hypothetical protein